MGERKLGIKTTIHGKVSTRTLVSIPGTRNTAKENNYRGRRTSKSLFRKETEKYVRITENKRSIIYGNTL